MKTLNIQYSGDKALKEFMEENNILQKQNVLLQIFTAICEVEFIEELVSSIKKTAPNINIIGATTDGEIIEEKVVSHSTILSFSIFENTKIKLYTTTAQKASFQTAKRLLKKIEDVDDAKVAIVFTDGLNINGEVFLKAFNKHVPNLTVAGGLAADNAQFNKTYVFTGDGIVNNSAVAAVLYSPDLIVNTAFSFGWEIIGKEFRVTNAIENRVYTIDNQTPIELYKKYLGDKIGGQLPATGIEFPLILNRDGIKIARAVVAKESDGSLIFAGNIKKGDKVSFGYGNVKHILNNITDTFDDIIQNPVESIFIYSCMARKRLLGDEIQTEIMPLSKIAPTSGFFTYGEFHNCNKLNSCKNQLLNQTMTILALSEDKNKINSNQTIQMPSLKKNMQTVEALSHLISQSTLELNELNENLEKRVHEEIEKNIQKDQHIVQQSRLAQMGEMISMIAHQWRQPLTAISSTSAGINLKAKLNKLDKETAVELSDKISDYSQHLSSTIDDFREFFKPNKEKKETTYNKVIQSVLNIVETSIKNKNITIVKNLNSKEVFNTYPNEIKQVVLNLIKNAEDVLIEHEVQNPTITIKTNDDELIVKDNGGGIPEDIMPKIFDPYFSTKTKKDGTGLGLYMSKSIIQEHCGGELSVANDKDGAVFKIELKR